MSWAISIQCPECEVTCYISERDDIKYGFKHWGFFRRYFVYCPYCTEEIDLYELPKKIKKKARFGLPPNL